MAKKSGNQPNEDRGLPKELPHDPPLDDIADIVEFVDEPLVEAAADEPRVFTFADEANFDLPAPRSSDSVPHVTQAPSMPPISAPASRLKETDSVMEDELVNLAADRAIDSAQVSEIFSSVIRQEPESAVQSQSEIIRGEPLSDTIALDPISEVVAVHADSDVRAVDLANPVEVMATSESDIVEGAVLESDVVAADTSEVALPESAVRDEIRPLPGEDAIGGEDLVGIADSSVSLKSMRGLRRFAEQEPVLDLDESLAELEVDEPEAVVVEEVAAPTTRSSDDVDFDDLIVDEAALESSSVNLGQKPPRSTSASGIDPVAEALESGTRLDQRMPRRDAASSVQFDELVNVGDDVDLGAAESPKPKKASAKLPKAQVEDMSDLVDDNAILDEVTDIDEPALAAEDDVDINQLLGDEPTESAPVVVEDEVAAVVEEEATEIFGSGPTTTPTRDRRGTRDDVPAPYVEPKRARGGWGSMLGGVTLGALLTAGAGAGVWYAAPGLISNPSAPDASVKATGKSVKKTPLQVARDALDQGKFSDAVAALKDVDADKPALGVRGEAKWLAYLEKATADKAPIDPMNDDVKAALKDLTDSENAIKLQQVQIALQAGTLKAEAEQAKKASVDEVAKAKAEKEMADLVVATIEKALRDAKLIAADDKLDAEAIGKAAKNLEEATTSLAVVNKLLDEAKVDAAGDKGVEKLLAAKKDFEEKFAEVNKLLAAEMVKDSGAKGLAEVLANRDRLAKDREQLERTMKAAFDELAEGKLVPEDSDPRKDLVAGAKAARSRAESPLGAPLASLAGSLGSLTTGVGELVKLGHDNAAAVAEIQFLRLRETLTPTPDQQLERLAAALSNRGETDAILIADANRLAEWVAAQDAKASPATKAKALFAQGLGQRNQRKFDDARQSLQKAAELVQGEKAPWADGVRRAHAELTDPAAYYIPRIEKYRSERNFAAALEELNAALAAIPNHPRLTAERGAIGLEQIDGKLDEATKAAIRAEATAAANDPKSAATGNFILGRLEEQSGNLPKAEEYFRQALKSAAPEEEQTQQIRLRLGRLLLKERVPFFAPAAPPAAPKLEEKNPEAAPAEEKVSMVHPLTGLAITAALSQPAGGEDEESPEVQARIKEAIEISRQLLNSKDKATRAQGHMLLGEALSRAGQRTEGLREYAKGLELLNPDVRLSKMLDDHPAFSVPDPLQRANPLLAEKHYGIGLHHFYQRRFREAEEQFHQAIAHFDKDARYYYYLGLTQFELGSRAKRDAAFHAWEQASRLEANARPSSREVNVSLERIQGDRRAFLNSYRAKAVAAR